MSPGEVRDALVARVAETAPKAGPAELPSWILSDDGDLVAVNKPGWLVCHPSKDGPWSSLVGALREHLGGAPLHLLSRLDRETSGLQLLARDGRTASRVQLCFEWRNVTKAYLAVLDGHLTRVTRVREPIGPDAASPVAVKQRVGEGRGFQKCDTEFQPLAHAGGRTLCRVRPHTGRRHQIRVHAAHLGHPVAGDKLYGPDEGLYLEFVLDGWTPRLAATLPWPRQLLHAWALDFRAPDYRARFTAPPAEDFLAALALFGFDPNALGEPFDRPPPRAAAD